MVPIILLKAECPDPRATKLGGMKCYISLPPPISSVDPEMGWTMRHL